ncbi:unnamed protein product [Closterium sp. Yama58-4]|nr:unnamed protein product [Closterium sp. Yama58-4]
MVINGVYYTHHTVCASQYSDGNSTFFALHRVESRGTRLNPYITYTLWKATKHQILPCHFLKISFFSCCPPSSLPSPSSILLTPLSSNPHRGRSLRNNQLSGCLLQPIPPSIKQYQLDSNFFSCGFSTPPDCTNTIISVQANCLGATDMPPCPMDPQRVKEVCASFCGLSATTPVCNGHGTCFYYGPNRIPTCACDTGYTNGELPGTCVAVPAAGGGTPVNFSLLTSLSVSHDDGGGAAMAVHGAEAVQPDNSVVLTSNSQAEWGAAFLVSRVRLFSYTVKNHSCGREIALKLSFSFSLAPAAASNGIGKGGLAFVIAAADTVPGGDGSTLGYSGMSERSVAVEFDSFKDASSNDPDSSHVGINVGGSVVSISTAAVPGLNTGSTMYAWIDYSPGKGGLLSVFVASAASRPAKPNLKRSVSLCGVLKPTFEDATFVVGFTAASSDPPQKHTVLEWSLDTEATFTTSGVNRYFRYASAGALQQPAGARAGGGGGGGGAAAAGASTEEEQQWAVATDMTWVRADRLPHWPVRSQAGCGDCWAYAVVASIEAAYAILSANGSLPVFSVDSLLADMKADCSGGSPSKAFQYLLAVSKQGGGLQLHRGQQGSPPVAATAAGGNVLCSPLLKPIAALLGMKCTSKENARAEIGYSITGFERAAFYSWFGLVLAVQRQPVVVHIEASADSFLNYDGLHKYQDPACFTYNLNHVVLLVGYRLVGKDSRFPHMAPPFWIIRNSWGPDWGDGGHMRMDIQGGDGVCGINTLPGIYPIVRVNSVLRVSPPTTITPCSVYYTTEQVKQSPICSLCVTLPLPTPCHLPAPPCPPPVPPLSPPCPFPALHPPPSLPTPCPLPSSLSPQGDTCEALATYFSLASTCPSAECTAAFQALNPGVDCTANSGQLPSSQAVCVERRAEMAGVVALCSQYYYVESAETCESIRNVPDPPLSRVDFYRLNPGIKCSRLVPKTDVGSFTGFEACVGSTESLLQGTCPRSTAITIGTGDRCTAIQVKYFRGVKGCYKRINGYDCIDRLIKGTKVCIPSKVKIAKGKCEP